MLLKRGFTYERLCPLTAAVHHFEIFLQFSLPVINQYACNCGLNLLRQIILVPIESQYQGNNFVSNL